MFIAKENFKFNGKRYTKGEQVAMPEKDAAPLKASGLLLDFNGKADFVEPQKVEAPKVEEHKEEKPKSKADYPKAKKGK